MNIARHVAILCEATLPPGPVIYNRELKHDFQ